MMKKIKNIITSPMFLYIQNRASDTLLFSLMFYFMVDNFILGNYVVCLFESVLVAATANELVDNDSYVRKHLSGRA
jgi:hypothetical protein